MDDLDLEEGDDLPTAPFWMTTFSDMVTLLLTFFVLIVSMSEVEVQKFREALSNFPGRTGLVQFEAMLPPVMPNAATEEAVLVEQAERFEELLAYIEAEGLQDKVRVNLTSRGLHVSITDSVVFASGSATLLTSAQEILRKIAAVVGTRADSVQVEGHTDDRPIQTSAFPSNWELSAARAAAVVRFFLEQETALAPERYAALGRGEFHPVASNDTPEGRARNRRVDILFVSRHGSTD